MKNEYDKCNFCKHYDTFDGCTDLFCNNYNDFVPNKDKLVEVSHQKEMSVSDLMALINLK